MNLDVCFRKYRLLRFEGRMIRWIAPGTLPGSHVLERTKEDCSSCGAIEVTLQELLDSSILADIREMHQPLKCVANLHDPSSREQVDKATASFTQRCMPI